MVNDFEVVQYTERMEGRFGINIMELKLEKRIREKVKETRDGKWTFSIDNTR